MDKLGFQKELDYANISKTKWVFIALGLILAFSLLENYFRKDNKIEQLIKDLKGDN